MSNITSLMYNMLLDQKEKSLAYDLSTARILQEAVFASPEPVPAVVNDAESYMRKVDEAFSVLSNLSVDNTDATEFFEKIQNARDIDEEPLTIPWMNVNEIGRIRGEYLLQMTKEMSRQIDEILNGNTSMREVRAYFDSNPFVKIKKQLVSNLSNEYRNMTDYFKNRQKPILVPIDSQSIMSTCMPFLRSFAVKKKEMVEEVASVKSAILSSKTMLQTYSDTVKKLLLEKKLQDGTIETVNFYLYNMSRGVDELCSFLTFMMMNKINLYVFNVNSLNELYAKAVGYRPEGILAYHESAYEDSVAGVDVDSVVNALVQGDPSALVDYAIRENNYCRYLFKTKAFEGSRCSDGSIEFQIDQFTPIGDPYKELQMALTSILAEVEALPKKLEDQFASVPDILKNAGLADPLSSRFATMIPELGSTAIYSDMLNDGEGKSKILLSILGELRDTEKSFRSIVEKSSEIYKKILYVKNMANTNINNKIENPVVRSEAIEGMNGLEMNYRNFLGDVARMLIERMKHLEDQCVSILESMFEVVDTPSEEELYASGNPNFNEWTMEDDLLAMDINAKYQLESAMRDFKALRNQKLYGAVFEADAQPANAQQPTQPAATPQNTQPAQTAANANKSTTPSVQEDPNQQSPADQAQNNAAADQAKPQEPTPEKKRDLKTKLMESATKMMQFFQKTLNTIRSKIREAAKAADSKNVNAFLAANKEALLARSYSGVALQILPYHNLPASTFAADINAMKNNLNAINEQNVMNYKDMTGIVNTLFSFIRYNGDVNKFNEYIKSYYLVGDGKDPKEKETIKNNQLKSLVPDMISFVEGYYGSENGDTDVLKAMDTVDDVLRNKLQGIQNPTDESVAAIQLVSREVQIFCGALLTGYRNRAVQYYTALQRLVPKSGKNAPAANDANANQTTDQNTQQVTGQEPAQNQGGEAAPAEPAGAEQA